MLQQHRQIALLESVVGDVAEDEFGDPGLTPSAIRDEGSDQSRDADSGEGEKHRG